MDAFNFRYAEYVSLLEHYNMVGKSFKLLLHIKLKLKSLLEHYNMVGERFKLLLHIKISLLEHYNMVGKSFKLLLHIKLKLKSLLEHYNMVGERFKLLLHIKISLLEHYNMVGKSFKLLLHVTIEIKFKRMIRHPDHELYSPQHALVEETNIEEEIVEKDQHSWMRLHVDLSFQRIAIITLSLSLLNHCYHHVYVYE